MGFAKEKGCCCKGYFSEADCVEQSDEWKLLRVNAILMNHNLQYRGRASANTDAKAVIVKFCASQIKCYHLVQLPGISNLGGCISTGVYISPLFILDVGSLRNRAKRNPRNLQGSTQKRITITLNNMIFSTKTFSSNSSIISHPELEYVI